VEKSGVYISLVLKSFSMREHFCPILNAAEKISGYSVDCVRKHECNKATACVLFDEHDRDWDALTQYFVNIARKSAEIESRLLNKPQNPSDQP